MKRHFIFWPLFAVLAAAGIFGARHYASRLDVVVPLRDSVVQAVYATGTVEPSVMFPIAPRSAGRLMALYADEGQRVTKGQVLAQIEDADLQQALDQAKANLDQAARDYARKNGLLGKHAVAPETVEQALAARDADTAAVAQIQAQMDYMKLQAPADGTILRRDGEIGELIPPNQAVFTMAASAPMRVAAEVDEEDIALVQPGQTVAVGADAFPGKIFGGKVLSITPKGDPVARSYRVRIGLDGETPLMTGMTAETNILVRQAQNALLVPQSAVSGGHVWVVRNGQLSQVSVETGVRTAKAVEILSGLADGDTVVMTYDSALKAGEHIQTTTRPWQDK